MEKQLDKRNVIYALWPVPKLTFQKKDILIHMTALPLRV